VRGVVCECDDCTIFDKSVDCPPHIKEGVPLPLHPVLASVGNAKVGKEQRHGLRGQGGDVIYCA